jgi:hypothetical protein
VNSDEEYARMVTESHLHLLLYFRNIGADDLLLFAEKGRRWCEDCGRLVLSEIGFHSPDAYEAYLEDLTDRMVRECEFGPSKGGYFPAFKIYHPEFFDEPMDGILSGSASARSLKKRKRSLIAEVVSRNVDQLIADIGLALQWQSPLGSTNKFHRQILRHNISGTEEAQVAFNVKLPVLRNVNPVLLIRIRQEEAEHFIAFRRSLQLAIRERLQATPDKDPAMLAAQIQSEVIQPQLDNIARRLRAAQKLLVQKSATRVAVSVLTTTCGLLTANPLMITTGAGAAMTALPAVDKYLDDRRDIALSDMYFAWQAQKHAAEEH